MCAFDAVESLSCTDCGGRVDPAETSHRCPDCGGVLSFTYPYDRLDLSPSSFRLVRFDGLRRYEPVLPFDAGSLVTLAEGTTPLVGCPDLAADVGIDEVFLKREGANPTGSVADRGLALAVSAALAHDADRVALPSTGPGGVAAAAYGARVGIETQVYVPSRSTFDAKAMTNVHGGEMTVVDGGYADAVEAFEDDDGYSLAPFDTPYRYEGAKTLAYEIAEQLEWSGPDAVVVPEGHGTVVAGVRAGFEELVLFGLIETRPALYIAQPSGCAPFVEAFRNDADAPSAWERPDTVCGPLAVARPDSRGGSLALDALAATGGGAVAVDDATAMAHAVDVASTDGVPVSVTGGVATAAVDSLSEEGLSGAECVVAVDPIAADAEADLLRSHLMSTGV
ncbi:MAG: pyridoxal-phosphate dependent enzyme [Haloarculaceae archaeon]